MKTSKWITLSAIALLFSSCVPPQQQGTTTVVVPNPNNGISTQPQTQPQNYNPDLSHLYTLRSDYIAGDYQNNPKLIALVDKMVNTHGFDRNYLYGVFSQVNREPKALELIGAFKNTQVGKGVISKTSNNGSWETYYTNHAGATRVAKGVQFWRENAQYLNKATAVYGVAPEYILGIIGVETNFGGFTGTYPVLNVLTSIGLEHQTRSKFFMDELEAYLLMTKEQQFNPTTLKGSYAGAFGYAQFMPSSFRAYGVDFDGNGRTDLFTPADAIGSIANYFKKHKWSEQVPVTIPAYYSGDRFTSLDTGFDTKYSQDYLKSVGIVPTMNFYGYTGEVSLIKLTRLNNDELWMGAPNFYVITRYNHVDYYAMAVHQLAQEIRNAYFSSMTR